MMGKKNIGFVFFIFALFSFPLFSSPFYVEQLPPEERNLWDHRDDLKNTEKLFTILSNRYAAGDTSESLLILLPRLSFWYVENLMDRGVKDKEQLLKIADVGIKAGEKCMKLYSDEPGCYFWYVVTLSRAQSIKGVSISTISLLSKMQRLMEKVDKMDPDYFYGGTYRYRGRVIYEVPWIVRKVAGHSLQEAVDYYRKAEKVAPYFFMTHVYLAEVYIKMKKYKLARKELEFVIRTPVNKIPNVIPENKRWKRKALELKKKYYSLLYE